MSRGQKILLVLIGAELVSLAVLARAHRSQPALPRVNLSRFLPETAEDIAHFPDHVDPANPQDWIELADKYRTFGLFPEADYCFRQRHALGPSKRDYLFSWAIALDRGGQLQEALARYEEAAAADLRKALRCRLNIGLIQLRLGEYGPAEQSLREASSLPRAKMMLARRLMRSGRADEAVTLLDDLLRQFPDDLHVNQLRGWAEEERGHPSAAWPYQDRSLRGAVRIFSGDEEIAALDQQRRAAVGDQRASLRCDTLVEQRRFQDAIDLLRGTSWGLSSPVGYADVASWEMALQHLPQAKDTLQKCLAHFGAEAPTLKVLGDVYTRLGEHEQARTIWLRAIDLQADAELHQRLADSWAGTPDKAAAQRHAALAGFYQGKEAWLQNDLPTAKEKLTSASRAFPDHAPTWFYLAETLRLLGDKTAAREAYQHCLRADRGHGRALRNLSRLTSDEAR